MATSSKAGDPFFQMRGSPSYPRRRRLFFPSLALRTMALLRTPAVRGPRARRGQCYGLSVRGGPRRRVTPRYEPGLRAFGLESKACSRFGSEFSFLVSFGAFLFSLEPLRRISSSNFPEIQIPEKFVRRRFSNFSFVLGFLDPGSNLFPTEDREGVRIGSGGDPNDDERRRSRESFLIHQIDRSSFVARKQRIFASLLITGLLP